MRHRPRFRVVLLALALATPLGVQAQTGPGQNRGLTIGSPQSSAELRVLEATIEAVAAYGLDARTDSALFELAIDGLIRGLDDPYATVLTPDEVREFEEQSTGNYAGIGIAISRLNGAVTITEVFRNTPAERAGLEVGDRIVQVGTENGREWNEDDASSRIRGRPGTTVVVSVERDGFTDPIAHEMERAEVHVPAVSAERIFDDIAYIAVERVTRMSSNEVDSIVVANADASGLILDLRRNPGGYLDEALRMSDVFLPRGSVLARTRARVQGNGTDLREESHYDRLAPRIPDMPIVVLVDQYSASAAEIVAGALQDHDRALVLGERTFGKGTVQSVIPLPEGRLLRVTSGEWLTPQGRSLNRKRDADGHPIEQAADSVPPTYLSVAGRPILGGGGVFPDLEILQDTLTTNEQAVPLAAVESQIPLARRVQEAAFATGRRFRDGGQTPNAFPNEDFEAFVAALVAEGIPQTAFNDEARAYLRWQLESQMYTRMENESRYLEVLAGRDKVLSAAVRFLEGSTTQADLFAHAAEERAAALAQRGAAGLPVPPGAPTGN